MVRAFPMKDPTFLVLLITTCVALGVFLAGCVVEFMRRRGEVDLVSDVETGLVTEVGGVVPPPLPGSGVEVWYYRWTDWLWALVICGFFVGSSLAGLAMAKEDAGEVDLGTLESGDLAAGIVMQLMFAGATALVVVKRVSLVRWLGLRWPGWAWVMVIAPGALFGMWTLGAVLQGVGYMGWLESLGVETQQDTVRLLHEAKDPMVIVMMGVMAVVVAPICEEVVFRGFLYPLAKRYAGVWAAVISSGLLFAVAHPSLMALLPLAVLGMGLAVIYERTRSIWAPIAVHAVFNGATVAIQLMIRYEVIPMPEM
jgi:membrane protease YdiL (CAAX protease family)